MTDESTEVAVLTVRDLRVSYADSPVLVDGVSLEVRAGECLALVGESGSGKSLTAMASMGLLDLDPKFNVQGSVRIHGREMNGASYRDWRSIRGAVVGMIFQDPQASLNPSKSVGRQIAEVVRAHRGLSRRDTEREVHRLLDAVGIGDAPRRSRAYPHEFSGGMRQRVMIAIALAGDPSLIIADEPTTALDVTVQAQLLDLLRELQESRDLAMLFISHDLGVVADIANRVAVMLKGELVETGPASQLFDDAKHPYTQKLLSASKEFGDVALNANIANLGGMDDRVIAQP
jgi:ABC-type dipeptide/oligopeptide/nickel transport system ATPase component